MLISSEAGSAQIAGGAEARFYDDVGCLAADWRSHADGERAFVRLATGAWIAADEAAYVRAGAARTAMGSGVVAFRSAADAAAAADDGAAPMTFAELVEGARR